MEDAGQYTHGAWREAAQRFDYFVNGVAIALVAYVGQNFSTAPRALFSAATFELLALGLLLAAVIAGLKRLEGIVVHIGLNYGQLTAEEMVNLLAKGIQSGGIAIDPDTNNPVPIAKVEKDRDDWVKRAKTAAKKMQELGQRSIILYNTRNWLLLVGFVMLIGSRVYGAYEEVQLPRELAPVEFEAGRVDEFGSAIRAPAEEDSG